MNTDMPQAVTLSWCDKCGRDDRLDHLGDRHYWNGYWCSGEIRKLTYALVKIGAR